MSAAALLVALTLAPLANAAKPVPDSVYCGDVYWFDFETPKGWGAEAGLGMDGPSVTLIPQDGGKYTPAISLDVSAQRVTIAPEAATAPALLRHSLLVLRLGAAPVAIEDVAVDHPSLPAAALRMTLESGSLVLAVLAGVNGAGRSVSFRFAMASRQARFSPESLAVFRRTVRSLRFDPRLGCRPTSDGGRSRVELQPVPAAAALSQAGSTDAHHRAPPMWLGDLGRGCGDLQTFFTPVTCSTHDHDGALAMLVDFNTPSKARSTEELGGSVGAWFCYAARDKGFARRPELIFETDDPTVPRYWDCEKRGLGGRFSGELRPIKTIEELESHHVSR
jgi:hypothetical protein